MSDNKLPSILGTFAEEVLGVFQAELQAVQFPGMDLDVLQRAASQVHGLALEMEKAEAAVSLLHKALHTAQEDLNAKCQKAVSYARIYADGNGPLLERLDGLMPRRARNAELEDANVPKKRRRTPKGFSPETNLFETATQDLPSA